MNASAQLRILHTESEVRQSAQYWLKSELVQAMKMAVYGASPTYLQSRDRLLVRALYQWALRARGAAGLDPWASTAAVAARRTTSGWAAETPASPRIDRG